MKGEFPEFEEALKTYIKANYKDSKLKFLKDMILSIPYDMKTMNALKADEDVQNTMIFSLKSQSYEEGELILSESSGNFSQKAKSIIFVERGYVEIMSQVSSLESPPFAYSIDKLGEGSCINSRAYITGDSMVVNFKAGPNCRILELMREDMDKIIRTTPFGNTLGVYETKTLKMQGNNMRYLLDYTRLTENEEEKKKMRVKNMFKNALMLIIVDIRDRRNRPKLSDFLKLYAE